MLYDHLKPQVLFRVAPGVEAESAAEDTRLRIIYDKHKSAFLRKGFQSPEKKFLAVVEMIAQGHSSDDIQGRQSVLIKIIDSIRADLIKAKVIGEPTSKIGTYAYLEDEARTRERTASEPAKTKPKPAIPLRPKTAPAGKRDTIIMPDAATTFATMPQKTKDLIIGIRDKYMPQIGKTGFSEITIVEIIESYSLHKGNVQEMKMAKSFNMTMSTLVDIVTDLEKLFLVQKQEASKASSKMFRLKANFYKRAQYDFGDLSKRNPLNWIGAMANGICKGVGDFAHLIGEALETPFDLLVKRAKKSEGWARAGNSALAFFIGLPLKATGTALHLVGAGLDTIGKAVQDFSASVGQLLSSFGDGSWAKAKETLKKSGATFTRAVADLVMAPLDMINELGSEIKDMGNVLNIPVISPIIRGTGNLVIGVTQLAEGITQGIRKCFVGEFKEAGKLVAAGFKLAWINTVSRFGETDRDVTASSEKHYMTEKIDRTTQRDHAKTVKDTTLGKERSALDIIEAARQGTTAKRIRTGIEKHGSYTDYAHKADSSSMSR